MSSIGIPELDSSDTKLCRSSLGVQNIGSIPAAATTRAEGSADVCGIKRGADGRREHKIELLELASAFGTLLLDQIPVLHQRFDAAGRQLECAA
jgi:hypothetical protein